MRIILLIVSLFLVGCSQPASETPIQPDLDWTQGELENGVKYHIYPNDKEPVSLRLYVHVGSVNETENQKGYAHFLEHMAFNGSTHFTSNDVVKMFEESGLSFGADINAYTSYYETVYKLDLPDKSQLENGVKWMRDIGDGLTISDEEVEKEKGVIQGEIRRNRPDNKAFNEKFYDHLIKGTALENADPVGTVESVNDATAQSIRAFYEYWYQPHFSEVIITGDVDVEQAKKLVQTHFASWKKSDSGAVNKVDKIAFDLVDYVDTIGQYESPGISLMSVRNPVKHETREQIIDSWLDELALDIINHRLTSEFSDTSLPVEDLFAGRSSINEHRVAIYSVSFPPEHRDSAETLFLQTLASLRDHGVQANDIGVSLSDYEQRLRDLDHDWAQQDATNLSEGRTWNLSIGQQSQSKQDYRESLEGFIASVDLQRVNERLRSLLRDEMVVLIGAGEEESLTLMEKRLSDVRTTLAAKGKKPTRTDGDITGLDEPKQKGDIASQQDNEQGFHVWTLSNGIEVWFERDDTLDEQVDVVYVSQGGRAALSPELFAAEELAIPTVTRSGIGGFNGPEFDKFLRSQNIDIAPFIGFTQHGIELGTDKENLAQAFKVIYNIATNIRVDERQLDKVRLERYEELERILATPMGQWHRAINRNNYLSNSRHYSLTSPDYATVTSEQIHQVHNELFGKNRGNKLVVIADMEASDLTALLRQYIASIPLEKATAPNYQVAYNVNPKHNIDLPEHNEQNSLYLVRVTNSNASQPSVRTVFMDDMLQRILFKRLNEYVREELSLDYAPDAYGVNVDQEPSTDWFIETQAAPKDLDQIKQAIDVVLLDLKKGVSQKELETSAKQLVVALQPMQDDSVDRAWLYGRYLAHGYGVDALKDVDGMVNSITLEDLNQRIQESFGEASVTSKYSLTPKK
ncbi:M16 family metallopeptidase [Vibrio japonicus]|uniref:Insulinase family protein n=1 Tax=Vibrio japonicus TaxID=1824638 RepID=A0ABY5LQ25_9VIBR|nr:M16 family metallopeptidase [Vibrio japonicus]UUM32872.1 insulinase family protein [Vibrio japonicus]